MLDNAQCSGIAIKGLHLQVPLFVWGVMYRGILIRRARVAGVGCGPQARAGSIEPSLRDKRSGRLGWRFALVSAPACADRAVSATRECRRPRLRNVLDLTNRGACDAPC